jgi:hypothetical protein
MSTIEADRPATLADFEKAGSVFGAELGKIASRNVIDHGMTRERNFEIAVGVCEMRIGELRKMEATDEQITAYMLAADVAYLRTAPEASSLAKKTMTAKHCLAQSNT